MNDTYATATKIHSQAIAVDLIARVRCDNAAAPTWWAEAINPQTGEWTRIS